MVEQTANENPVKILRSEEELFKDCLEGIMISLEVPWDAAIGYNLALERVKAILTDLQIPAEALEVNPPENLKDVICCSVSLKDLPFEDFVVARKATGEDICRNLYKAIAVLANKIANALPDIKVSVCGN